MEYVIGFVIGAIVAGCGAYLILHGLLEKVQLKDKNAEVKSKAARDATEAAATRAAALEAWAQTTANDLQAATEAKNAEVQRREAEVEARERTAVQHEAQFNQRLISYRELRDENTLLKQDLQNIDVNLHKLEIDGNDREKRLGEIDARSQALAKRYLAENVKAIVAAVGPDNFTSCKSRLTDVIARVRDVGFEVTSDEEARLFADLRLEFEKQVRLALDREEQARIKAQIREEERLRKEVERELKQVERERLAIQAALDQAMAAAKGEFSAQVEDLKKRLQEAEDKSKRTMSMAQQTKSGFVYVISNLGAFGSDVYKVGMTRRLQPQDRVDELSSASVPFPFDVHMMINCVDAPGLENALHRALHKHRINKANPRKEFFKVTLDSIRKLVLKHHGEVVYTADPEALQYHQSLTMSQEDAEYIERVYDQAEEATGSEPAFED